MRIYANDDYGKGESDPMSTVVFVFAAQMLLNWLQWESNPRSYIILLTHSFTHCNGATQATGVQGVEILPESTVAAER